MLSGAAFNALLKTLEEPPGHVKFIFATTEPHKLPDTILSRCQRHNFRRIPAARMLAAAEGDLPPRRRRGISDRSLVAGGAPVRGRHARRALAARPDPLRRAARARPTRRWPRRWAPSTAPWCSSFAEALVRRTPSASWTGWRRSSTAAWTSSGSPRSWRCSCGTSSSPRPPARRPPSWPSPSRRRSSSWPARRTPAQLARLFDIVHGCVWDVSRAAQPRLALEMALLKAIQLAPAASIPELLARVERLSAPAPREPTRGREGPAGAPGGRSASRHLSRLSRPRPRRRAPRRDRRAPAAPSPRSIERRGGPAAARLRAPTQRRPRGEAGERPPKRRTRHGSSRGPSRPSDLRRRRLGRASRARPASALCASARSPSGGRRGTRRGRACRRRRPADAPTASASRTPRLPRAASAGTTRPPVPSAGAPRWTPWPPSRPARRLARVRAAALAPRGRGGRRLPLRAALPPHHRHRPERPRAGREGALG